MITLILNGHIYSPSNPNATALAFKNGIVIWIGDDLTGLSHFPKAQIIDLCGSFVTPAFVDSHVHTTAIGLYRLSIDLGAANSFQHCIKLLIRHISNYPQNYIIWGYNWDSSLWSDRSQISTSDLDEILGSRLVCITNLGMNAILATTALRKITLGLTEAKGYDPQLPLRHEAFHLIHLTMYEQLNSQQRYQAQIEALNYVSSLGIVSVHECSGPHINSLSDWQSLRSIEHGVEVFGYWGELAQNAKHAKQIIDKTGAKGLAGDIFVSDNSNIHMPCIHNSYINKAKSINNYCFNEQSIFKHIRACTEIGIPAGFNIAGNSDISPIISGFSKAVKKLGLSKVASCGHRLEQVQVISFKQILQLKNWGILASIHPNCFFQCKNLSIKNQNFESSTNQIIPLSVLAANGVPIAFGSYTPNASIDPWRVIYSTISRKKISNAISFHASLAAITRGGWRFSGMDISTIGVLVPGAIASYAVWNIDEIRTDEPLNNSIIKWSTNTYPSVPGTPELSDNNRLPQCLQTVSKGNIIYSR